MEVSFIRHSHQTLDGSLYRWFTNNDKETRKSTLKCKLLQIECIPLLHVPYVHTGIRYLSQSYNIIQYTVCTYGTSPHADVAENNVHSPA